VVSVNYVLGVEETCTRDSFLLVFDVPFLSGLAKFVGAFDDGEIRLASFYELGELSWLNKIFGSDL